MGSLFTRMSEAGRAEGCLRGQYTPRIHPPSTAIDWPVT